MEEYKTKLERLGVAPVSATENPAAYAELFRAARQLRSAGLKVVGLLPADDVVAVPPLALQLAVALSHVVVEGTFAVVDANTRRPALTRLLEESEQMSRKFRTAWIAERVTVITRAASPDERLDIDAVRNVVKRDRDRYSSMLVDFSGFERYGEHPTAFDLADGVLLVARVGKSKERDLLQLQAQIPEELDLGVMLVGG